MSSFNRYVGSASYEREHERRSKAIQDLRHAMLQAGHTLYVYASELNRDQGSNVVSAAARQVRTTHLEVIRTFEQLNESIDRESYVESRERRNR
jgi:hypothetical protein